MRCKNSGRTCSILGCERPAYAKTWCSAHYSRYRNYGDPEAGRTPEGEPLQWLKENMASFGDECVTWPYARKRGGYGAVLFEGKIMGAHRVACILEYGPPSEPDLMAAHSCGKGHEGCVNPKHLRWATAKENSDDRREHELLGIARPRRVTNGKLSDQDVREILELRGKAKIADVAKRYGVHESMISRINNGHRKTRVPIAENSQIT